MSLYVRSDFHVCPNPLSLDTYNQCPYQCKFCFVLDLQNIWKKNLLFNPISSDALKVKLHRAFDTNKESVLPEVHALRHNLPVIVSRKTEGFNASEGFIHNTYDSLKLLSDYKVPVVIETKMGYFPLLASNADKDFERIILDNNWMMNISIMFGDDKLSTSMNEPSDISLRWAFCKHLHDVGIEFGITGEPVLHGVNDSTENITKFAEQASEVKPNHVNFGELKISNPKALQKRFGEQPYLPYMIEEKKNWVGRSKEIFRILRHHGLKVVSTDWINHWDKGDFFSCCGLDGKYRFHRFNFQGALRILQSRGRVELSDLLPDNPFGESAIDNFKKKWNGEHGYYCLSDVPNVAKIGNDSEGNAIYGKKEGLLNWA